MNDMQMELAKNRRRARERQKRDTYGRYVYENSQPRECDLHIRLMESERHFIQRVAAASGTTVTSLVVYAVRYYSTLLGNMLLRHDM